MGKQLSFYLSDTEAKALNDAAQQSCRRMSDQARYILLTNLGIIAHEEKLTQSRVVARTAQEQSNAQPIGQ